MKSIAIRFSFEDGVVQTIEAAFEDNELDTLRTFAQYARELSNLQCVREGRLKTNYHMNWSRDTGVLSIDTKLPDADSIAAFLHHMRPFVLANEPTFFMRAVNLLKRRIASEEIRQFLDLLRDDFLGRRDSHLTISVGTVNLTSEGTLLKYLNAFEYHRDPEKRKELTDLHPDGAAHSLEDSKALFLSLMIDKAKAVFTIADIIENIDAERELHFRWA